VNLYDLIHRVVSHSYTSAHDDFVVPTHLMSLHACKLPAVTTP